MTRSRALVLVGLRRINWFLPWMGVLLVSATFAYAMNGALTGSWTIAYRPPTVWISPEPADLWVPDVVAADNNLRDSGHPCVSLFGSYNGWLFDDGHHGPCGLDADG